ALALCLAAPAALADGTLGRELAERQVLGEGGAGDTRFRASLLFNAQGTEFMRAVRDEMLIAAHQQGIGLAVYDAHDSASEQGEQVGECCILPRPMVVAATHAGTAAMAIECARESSQPVVFIVRRIPEYLLQSYPHAYLVTTDVNQAGELQAEALASFAENHQGTDRNGDKCLSIIILRGDAEHPDSELRTRAFLNAMERRHLGVRVLATADCRWDRGRAHDFVEGYLKERGTGDVDAVISNNDAMALGALDALRQHGFNLGPDDPKGRAPYIPVIGVDGIAPALRAVEKGIMLATVMQDPRMYAQATMRLLRELAAAGPGGHPSPERLPLAPEGQRLTVPFTLVRAEQAKALLQVRDPGRVSEPQEPHERRRTYGRGGHGAEGEEEE
nr:substrate-binding domain-containing protein [Succinivibrionaceae bacterium]